MNEDEVNNLIQRCKLLKPKFLEVFAANNFPKILQPNSFIIVSASTSDNAGTHWLLMRQKQEIDFCRSPWATNIVLLGCISKTGFYPRRRSA